MSSLPQVQERDRTGAVSERRERQASAPAVGESTVDVQSTSAGIRRTQAAIVAIAPAVMMVGLLYHPHIGNPADADFLSRLAAAVNADPTRWAIAHLIVALGSGFLALAFLAIRSHLREAGEERWSRMGLPFVVLGSTLYAMLPAMEFAPLAAAQSGADAQAAQAALFPWFIPTLFTSAVIFLIGACSFATAIIRSRALRSPLGWIVAGSLVVMAAARLVPLMAIQMNLQSIAGIAALWPLAYVMWMRPKR